MKHRFFAICILLVGALTLSAHTNLKNLLVEYTQEPLGMDVSKPRFSWQMEAEGQRGVWQKAYQLTVTDEKGNLVWNSGKVQSDVSLNVPYQGKALKPGTRYEWNLQVWNQKGQSHRASSWFETGLMCNADGNSQWNNAQWIGLNEDDLPFQSHYLPVFRMACKIQLDADTKSSKAGWRFGANDERLQQKHLNVMGMSVGKDEAYMKFLLDISPLQQGDSACVEFYRVGFTPKDNPNVPLKRIKVSPEIIGLQNCYESHQYELSVNMGHTVVYVDGKRVGTVELNPLGSGGDYIAFPVVGDIGLWLDNGQKALFSDFTIRNFRAPRRTLFIEKRPEHAVNSLFNPSRKAMPMLRSSFNVEKKEIRKARLYATARGIYEMSLNGKRIGEDYFAPGATQYNKTHLYQTYDILPYLKEGANVIGTVLGEGWWSGAATYVGDNWNFYGDAQSLLAKVVVTYQDGTETVLVSNPRDWKGYTEGPWLYGSFFQGEIYDATREAKINGWCTPEYDDSEWKEVSVVSLKEVVCPEVGDYTDVQLVGSYGQPVAVTRILTANEVEEVRPGVYVYDMGQNMAGVPEIRLSGLKSGTVVKLRYAEMKYPDLPEYRDTKGTLMMENIRAAMAQDIYVARGGEEVIAPRFTLHGYRYVEVSGIPEALPLENVKGTVLSSITALASAYETSNPMVNRLWENIVWSSLGNFISIPTDCPQRNERMGWCGDISVFSRTATYLADLPQFLSSYLRSMRDLQLPNGKFQDIAPMGGGFGGLLWGSAGITVPWECYQQYGDKALLEEHYEAMKRYIQFVRSHYMEPSTGLIIQNREWGDLGDWLGLEDNKNDKSMLWECYYIYDLDIMARVATILGKVDDAVTYRQWAKQRRTFFCDTYLDKSTGKTISSGFSTPKGTLVDIQTSYVLPLVFQIVKDEPLKEKLVENLIETILRKNRTDIGEWCPPFSLMTGFIGTAWILPALSESDYSEIAYRMLQQTDYPSWLYPVEQGATTIWERLNSYTHLNGFGGNNRMNSFNHYSFGAVGAWMYANSLGIRRDEDKPGFKHFVLAPEVDLQGGMSYAKGHYDSMYGRIASAWKIKDNKVYYTCSVPANTTATVLLPVSSVKTIKEGGKPLKRCTNIKDIEIRGNKLCFTLESGDYAFEFDTMDMIKNLNE